MDYKKLTVSNINAWAVWENETMKMPHISSSGIDKQLKPQIIFLGLNPSKSLTKIRNFHSDSVGDKRLKKAIQGRDFRDPKLSNLAGGFMTDLTDKIESDSSKVDLKGHSFQNIEDVLKRFGKNHYHMICFGGKTYEMVKNWLLNQKTENCDVSKCQVVKKPYEITLYKVMHYSYRFGENKVGEQLAQVNQLIDSTS
ncbi:MAG: hypothetical protein WEA58_10785 [Balneolaceae bacterium]